MQYSDYPLYKISKGEKERFISNSQLLIYPKYKQKNGLDGLSHINHVLKIGEELSKYYNNDIQYDIILGCLLHDIGRGYEVDNQTHGDAGKIIANKILNEYYDGSGFDFEKILYAIKNHDKGMITTDITIGTIWDADRLSLYRFKNRVVDTELLSTESAKKLLKFAEEYINNNASDYDIDYTNKNLIRMLKK